MEAGDEYEGSGPGRFRRPGGSVLPVGFVPGHQEMSTNLVIQSVITDLRDPNCPVRPHNVVCWYGCLAKFVHPWVNMACQSKGFEVLVPRELLRVIVRISEDEADHRLPG